MKFSILMNAIVWIIKLNMARHKYLRNMIKPKNHAIVMKTKDGKRGKRFIIKNGEFHADNDLDHYDLAFIWKDSNTAFKVFTSNDMTALHKAMANWDLELEGDESLSVWFSIWLGYATGMLKKS